MKGQPMDQTPDKDAPKSGKTFLAVSLAVVAGVIRIFPHPWNFTPVGALGLFGGARLRLWQALTMPLTIMVGTDLIIWAKSDWTPFNPYVYGSFIASVLIGRLLIRTSSPVRIGLCAVLVSVQFFVITNFGVWAKFRVDPQSIPGGAAYTFKHDDIYPNPTIYYADDARGLAANYWLAAAFSRPEAPPLGFFGNLLAGDLFFSAVLFGAYAWLGRRIFKPIALPATR
jgi:hypothetical protein